MCGSLHHTSLNSGLACDKWRLRRWAVLLPTHYALESCRLQYCNATVCVYCHAAGSTNQVAMYDYTRVRGVQSAAMQPYQRFIGHTDVVTAVTAGEGMFKDCFLSGMCVEAEACVSWLMECMRVHGCT